MLFRSNCRVAGFERGILLASSRSNTLTSNVATNNEFGIYLDSSSSNNILNRSRFCDNYNEDIYLDLTSTNNTGNNRCDNKQDIDSNTGFTCMACSVPELPPQITILIPPSPANNSVQASKTLELHTSVTSDLFDIDTCILELDGVNGTMNKIGTGTSVQCKATKTLLDRISHTFTVYANDTLGNIGRNGTWSFTVQLPSQQTTPQGGLPPQTFILTNNTGHFVLGSNDRVTFKIGRAHV